MNNERIAILSALIFRKVRPFLEKIEQFSYAYIKGEALSMSAYGSLALREFSDIDILIPRNLLGVVQNILSELDFTQHNVTRKEKILMLSTSHQTSPWVKEVTPFCYANIDLNFDIFWGEYTGKRVNIEEFLSDNVEIEVYGVKVKTLSPLKTIVQLILHHYKDLNSIFLLSTRPIIRQEMFKEIYYLLKNNIDVISLNNLYEISMEYEIIPYVYYMLYYTGEIYEDETLKKYIEVFKTSEGDTLLNCYGLNEFERKEWRFDFQTRLASCNLYSLIENDLTDMDREKILINKRSFE